MISFDSSSLPLSYSSRTASWMLLSVFNQFLRNILSVRFRGNVCKANDQRENVPKANAPAILAGEQVLISI